MATQYLAPRTVRAFTRAGFAIVGTAAIRNGVAIARRDGQWLVSRRGDSASAIKWTTIAEAIKYADRLDWIASRTARL